MMPFNANDYVRVRLTDYGRRCLRKNYDDLMTSLRGIVPGYEHPFPFELPAEDADGWSRWQLWILMRDLGPHMRHAEAPFHTTIRIEEAAP